MMSRTTWLLLTLMLVLGAYAAWRHPWTAPVQRALPLPAWVRHPPAKQVTPAAFHAFALSARKAETLSDPLQRCLAYPDPPGLHWDRQVTTAFCRLLLTSWVSRKQAARLIRTGHAAELDAKLAVALKQELASPGNSNALDHTYYHLFYNALPGTRALVDAWTRQRPASAYAWAASGTAYAAMASHVRGEKYIQDTPDSSIKAMDHYFLLAKRDLDHAVRLNPRLVTAYAIMIRLSGLEGSDRYAENAARRGLALDPANYSILLAMAWLRQPKWGGSISAMQSVVIYADRHADANPLLRILDAYKYGGEDYFCVCHHWGPRYADRAYFTVFDHVPPLDMLASAATAMHEARLERLAVIYNSEAYRFAPQDPQYLEDRAYELAALGDTDWALEDANAVVRQAPGDKDAYEARGAVYQSMGRDRLALADYRHALALDPADDWARRSIGMVVSRRKMISGALQTAVSAWASPGPMPRFRYALVDLNGDGRPDAIVLLTSGTYCGTGGCTMLVLEGTPHGFTRVSSSTIVNEPILVLPETRWRWRTLSVAVRGGGAVTTRVLMPFDGKHYPLNPSLQPAADAARLQGARKLHLEEWKAGAWDRHATGSAVSGR